MRNKKWVIGLFMLLLLGSLVLADNTTFYLRPKLGNDIRASATIDYNITLAENANCTGISLSRQTSITTDKYGIAPFPLNISNLNGYPLYVCEYQDNLGITLRKAHELGAGLFGILTVSKTANISRGLYLDNGLLRAANISVQNLNLSGNATSLNDFNLYLPSNRAINISIGGTQYSYLNSTENTFNVPIVLTGSFSDKNNTYSLFKGTGQGIGTVIDTAQLDVPLGASIVLSIENKTAIIVNGTTGYVGINNSNPQELLHVGNSTQASAQAGHGILMSNTGQAWVSARDPAGPTEAGVMAIGTVGYVGTWTSHQLIFRTGDTDRWNIDTNGNLGSNTAGGVLRFGAGDAITATEYEVARDADATNQLHFNVPAAASFEFSVNDVAQLGIFDGGIRSRTGDAGNPSYTFIGDTNTGLSAPSADTLGITTNSDFRLLVNNTNLNVTLPRIYFAPATVITFADRVNFSNAFSFNTSHIIPAVNNATILGVQGVINASESSPFAFKEIIVNRVSAQHNLTAWIFNLPISTYPIGVGGATHSTSFRINDTAWFIGSVQVGSTNTYAAMNIQLGRDQNPPVSLPDQITIAGVFSQTENVSLSNGNVFIDNDKNRICLGCNGLNVVAMTQNQASETIISDVVNITTLIQIDSAGNHNFTMQQVVCVNGTGYLGVCTTQPNATGGCNCQSRVIT